MHAIQVESLGESLVIRSECYIGFRSELHRMYGMGSMSANKTEVQSNFKHSKSVFVQL
jgi:hypothetical protein